MRANHDQNTTLETFVFGEGSDATEDITVRDVETGTPVKGYLYHGSRTEDLDELRAQRPPYKGGLGYAVYLAEREEASNYGPYLYRVPIDLKNPKQLEPHQIEISPNEIDSDLLSLLKEHKLTFNQWYEREAGYGAEFDHPFGSFDDVVESEEGLPKAFLQHLSAADRTKAVDLSKQMRAINVDNDELLAKAAKEAGEDREKYRELSGAAHTAWRQKRDQTKKSYEEIEQLWDAWDENNVPMIPSSVLNGENVPPFWYTLKDEVHGVFDDSAMEDVAGLVEGAGHDGLFVYGLRMGFSAFDHHEVLLFEDQKPDMVFHKNFPKGKKIGEDVVEESNQSTQILTEGMSKDEYVWKRKHFSLGTVDAMDGEVLNVYKYREMERCDFHHSFFMNHADIEGVEEDERFIFWFLPNGDLYVQDRLGNNKTIQYKERILAQVHKIQESPRVESFEEASGKAKTYMYHVTTMDTLAIIQREGLRPGCEMRGMCAEEEDYEDRVYFFQDKDTAEDGIMAWMIEHPRFENVDKAALIKVDVTGMDLTPDPELAGSYFTRDHVELSRIASHEVIDLGVDEAIGPEAGHAFYFHGTKADVGRKILDDGYLDPPDIGRRKAALTPRKGMVYLSNSFEYALAYAVGGHTEGRDFSEEDRWWWQNKGEAAIVRVSVEDIKGMDPDEDDVAGLFAYYEDDDGTEIGKQRRAVVDEIFRRFIKGDWDLERRFRELKHDPALFKAVRVAKKVMKKMKPGDVLWPKIKALVNNAAHHGRAKVHDVLFFNGPDLMKLKRPSGGYTYDYVAKNIGKIESPKRTSQEIVVSEGQSDHIGASLESLSVQEIVIDRADVKAIQKVKSSIVGQKTPKHTVSSGVLEANVKSETKPQNLEQYLLEECVETVSGSFYHGTPMDGLVSMLVEGIHGTEHNEFSENDTLSTSANPEMLRMFSERRKDNGLEFAVSSARVLIVDDVLATALTTRRGSGIDFDVEDEELREFAERFDIPMDDRGRPELPYDYIESLGVDAFMYEYAYRSMRGGGGRHNDEMELCFVGPAVSKLSEKIEAIFVDGEEYPAERKAEALKAAKEICSKEGDCNEATSLPGDPEDYIAGHCGHFAIALAEVFGYSIGIMYDDDGPSRHVAHMYGIAPDGNPVDVNGKWSSLQEMQDDLYGIWGSSPDNVWHEIAKSVDKAKNIVARTMTKISETEKQKILAYVRAHVDVYGPSGKRIDIVENTEILEENAKPIPVDSPEFKKWFKGSKVVDAEGKPLMVYHGSGTKIEKFDFSFTGKGNDQQGSGFYFTTSNQEARGYSLERRADDQHNPKPGGEDRPSVLGAYLSIKKPLEAKKIGNITPAQVRAIIMKAPDLEDRLLDHGDVESEGRSAVLARATLAYAGNRVDIQRQLFMIDNDFFRGDVKAFNEAVMAVLGYDGVHAKFDNQDHWVAWFPEQIMIVHHEDTHKIRESMESTPALSATQRGVVEMMQKHKEPIRRFPGGFWSFASIKINPRGVPAWYASTQTIRALLKAEVIEGVKQNTPFWKNDYVLKGQPLDEAKSVQVFDRKGDKLSKSPEDVLKNSRTNELAVVFSRGNVYLYDWDTPTGGFDWDKENVISATIIRDKKIIRVRRPDEGMFFGNAGGTEFNGVVQQLRRWVEKTTGENYQVAFGSTYNTETGKDTFDVRPHQDLNQSKELVLYHGTSDRFLDQIKKEGLRPGTGNNVWAGTGRSLDSHEKAIYLTHSKNSAVQYGQKAAQIYGGKHVVLKVTVPVQDLRPDDDYVFSLPLKARQKATWQDSLKKLGQVAYTRRIPASRIEVVDIGNYEIKKGRAEETRDYKQFAKLASDTKAFINRIQDHWQDAGGKQDAFGFDKLLGDIERSSSVPDIVKVAKHAYTGLSWILEGKDIAALRKLVEKLVESKRKLDQFKSIADKAQKVLASIGVKETNPYQGIHELDLLQRRADNEEDETKYGKAFDELAALLGEEGTWGAVIRWASDYGNALDNFESSVDRIWDRYVYNGSFERYVPKRREGEDVRQHWSRVIEDFFVPYFQTMEDFRKFIQELPDGVSEAVREDGMKRSREVIWRVSTHHERGPLFGTLCRTYGYIDNLVLCVFSDGSTHLLSPHSLFPIPGGDMKKIENGDFGKPIQVDLQRLRAVDVEAIGKAFEEEHSSVTESFVKHIGAAVLAGVMTASTPSGIHAQDGGSKTVQVARSAPSWSSGFLQYIQESENGLKEGWKDGKWYPHTSVEGGRQTIAYGHKIKNDTEQKRFNKGIIEGEAIALLREDLDDAWSKAASYVKKNHGVELGSLSVARQEMLVDYVFNIGSLSSFPKFTAAVVKGDLTKMRAEYKRYVKGQELKDRNQRFYARYLAGSKSP